MAREMLARFIEHDVAAGDEIQLATSLEKEPGRVGQRLLLIEGQDTNGGEQQ
jgi:hypothetical protein